MTPERHAERLAVALGWSESARAEMPDMYRILVDSAAAVIRDAVAEAALKERLDCAASCDPCCAEACKAVILRRPEWWRGPTDVT